MITTVVGLGGCPASPMQWDGSEVYAAIQMSVDLIVAQKMHFCGENGHRPQ